MEEEALRKFNRLLRILSHLSSPGGCMAKRLSEVTGMNVRTIYRDIEQLQDACFEIVQDKRGGPYRLNREYHSLGQTLSLEEVLALALGGCLLRDQLGDVGGEAMRKLQHFIKGDKLLKTRDFPDHVAVAPGPDRQAWIPPLMRALSERKRVRIEYQKGDVTHRTIDPYTLFYQDDIWYFQGWDHSRQDVRRFRLGRIAGLEVLEQTFSIPDAYRSDSALFHKWDIAGVAPTTVRCRVTPGLGQWLLENPVHPTQSLDDGEFQLQVRDLDALSGWILSLTGIEVLEPSELRDRIRRRAEFVVETYR